MQALGVALIWLLCIMLNRIVVRPALTAWSNGRLSLTGALLTLLIEQGSRARPRRPCRCTCSANTCSAGKAFRVVRISAVGAGRVIRCAKSFPDSRWFRSRCQRLIGYQFRPVFLIQPLVLACCFLIALIALSPAFGRMLSSPGLLAMRGALVLLSLLFLSYLPIFGSNMLLDTPLPMTWLRLSSATYLVLEFLLGFGGAVLVLEQSHRNVSAHNQALADDNACHRADSERDALTNADNRQAFSYLLNTAIADRIAIKCTVAMVDIDGLKQRNDSHGHAAGDDALIRVAKAVQNVTALRTNCSAAVATGFC